MYISNLTAEEYFYLNQDKIPTEIQDKFQEMGDRLISLEKENKVLIRNLELAEEQISFARNLVESLANLVEALDNTYWSSWQSTAKFSDELEVAREYLSKIKKGCNDESI